MEAETEFASYSLSELKYFSWVFLVYWILTVIATSTLVFYLSKVWGFVTTFALEWFLWKTMNIKVSIESLRISLLTGSIFFKNVCIIDENKTISILEGSITWRYWLMKTRRSEYELYTDTLNLKGTTEGGSISSNPTLQDEGNEIHQNNKINDTNDYEHNAKLSSLFAIDCTGVEIFIYNRRVAYDNIVKSFSKEERKQFVDFLNVNNLDEIIEDISSIIDESDETVSYRENPNNKNSFSSSKTDKESYSDLTLNGEAKDSINDRTSHKNNGKIKWHLFQKLVLDFFPIDFKINKGAMTIGNKFTRSLAVINFKRANGLVDYSIATSKLDLFKHKCSCELSDVEMSIKPNIGYNPELASRFNFRSGVFARVWGYLQLVLNLIPTDRLQKFFKKFKTAKSNNLFTEKWNGLSLYKENINEGGKVGVDDINFDFANHEYAKFSTFLKAPKLIITTETDVPGVVPHGSHPPSTKLDGPDVGNHESPPAFLVDLQLSHASIYFGPWMNRQIVDLRDMLYPTVSKDQKPFYKLKPGATRIHSLFKFSISILDELSLRVPTREQSKDKEFLEQYLNTNDDFRAFGWVDLTFHKGSEFIFNIPMVPDEKGFDNSLSIHLLDLEIKTSVNHDIFLKTNSFDINADIGYPLGWNEPAEWKFNILSKQLDLFLLREHVALFSDMIIDFSVQEIEQYEMFRPFTYFLNIEIDGYSFYFNVNDRNIINNPLDLNENCYLSFHGDKFLSDFTIPNTSLAQDCTTITYSVYTPLFRLFLNVPPWNTLNEFMKNKEIGRSYDFSIGGEYLLYSEMDVDNVDSLTMNFNSRGTALYCFGFVIKYLMNLQANYFGSFIKFVTTEEYSDLLRKEYGSDSDSVTDYVSSLGKEELNSAIPNSNDDDLKETTFKRADVIRTENETDIWLNFNVTDGALIFPEELYNGNSSSALLFGELAINLRTCNYYMDVLITMYDSTLNSFKNLEHHVLFEYIYNGNQSAKSQGKLSDITIHGHRMYGLPPRELTYFCQWSIDIGTFSFDSDPYFFKTFVKSCEKLKFFYSNEENSLLYTTDAVDDMTILTVNIHNLNVLLTDAVLEASIEVGVTDLLLRTIDFENEKYTKRSDLKIPELFVTINSLIDSNNFKSLFDFKTNIELTVFSNLPNYKEHLHTQRKFIALHDSPYHRCFFLLPINYQESVLYRELYGSVTPSFSLPILPLPYLNTTIDFIIEDILQEYSELFNTEKFEETFNKSRTIESTDMVRANHAVHSRLSQILETDSVVYQYETDNIILNLKYVEIAIEPLIVSHIENFTNEMFHESSADLIDKIEMLIVEKLTDFKNEKFSRKNLVLKVDKIDFIWGNHNVSYIGAFVDKVDVELSQYFLEEKGEKILQDLSIFGKFRTIRIGAYNLEGGSIEADRPPALSFVLEGFEGWSSETEKQVNCVNLSSGDVTIDESQVQWLVLYLNLQISLISKARDVLASIVEHRLFSQKNFISSIIHAGGKYRIDHDPYVVTKPASILRFSKGHIRENRSWRILTKLRYILTYLPEDWEELLTDDEFINKNSFASESKAKFLSLFLRNWKNWEESDITRSYIYKKIFETDVKKSSINNSIKITLESFYFTIYSKSYSADQNFLITKVNILLNNRSKELDGQSLKSNNELFVDVVTKVKTLKFEFTESVIKLGKNIESLLKQSSTHKGEVTNFSIPKFYKINLLFIFDHIDLIGKLYDTTLRTRIYDTNFLFFCENSKDTTTPSGSLVYFANRTEIGLKHSTNVLVESQVGNLFTSVTAELHSVIHSVMVNAQCTNIHIKSTVKSDIMANAIETIKKDCDVLVALLSSPQKNEEIHKNRDNSILSEYITKEEGNNGNSFDISINANVSNFSSEITFMYPLSLKHETRDIRLSFNKEGNNELSIAVLDTDIYLISNQTKEQYARLSYNILKINSSVPIAASEDKINLNVSLSILKLTTSDPRRMLFSFLQDEKQLTNSLDALKKLNDLFRINEKTSPDNNPSPYEWVFNFNIDYIGILLPIHATYYVLEFHNLLTNLSNEESSVIDETRTINGDLSFDNVIFLIKDHTIANKNTKILDFSIKLSTHKLEHYRERTFEIESAFFRVCFTPFSLIQTMWGYQQFLSLINGYYDQTSVNFVSFFTGNDQENYQANHEMGFNLRSFHILSYNFSIGWMFQNNDDSIPGLLLGYDRLFSTYEDYCGKLTLVDGFFSLANGGSSDTFYSSGYESDKYNRSYLPNIQILYWIKEINKFKQLFIKFHGETLDVNLFSNFIQIVEQAIKSIDLFQNLKRSKIDPIVRTRLEPDEVNASKLTISGPILGSLKQIKCEFIYDGGLFRLFSNSQGMNELDPTLLIKSPKVKILLDYNYMEKCTKKHWIKCLIGIEPTQNVLKAGCVPFLNGFFSQIQDIIETQTKNNEEINKNKNFDINKENSKESVNIASVLKPFDICFKIESGKQHVTLDCEPKAKIQTDIGFGSFEFSVVTSEANPIDPLVFSLKVNDVETSVKHLFSKEASASFKVSYVDIIFMFTHPKIFGSTLVDDVNLHFNIKQFQNITLFLDIWNIPIRRNTRPSMGENVELLDTTSSPFAQTITSKYTLPWSFIFIATNVKGDLNMGSTLGILKFDLQKTWMTTDHFQNKRQLFNLFTDRLSLVSEGRLGGSLDIENITWKLDVTYIDKYNFVESPLVDLLFNVGNVSMKIAFDYHIFLISTIKNARFHLQSEKDIDAKLPDLLTVSMLCGEIDICSTALLASNILDIYNTIMRTRQDNKNSYIETLLESNNNEVETIALYEDILKSLNLLQTDLSINIHKLNILVSPISLCDAEVIVLRVQDVFASTDTRTGEKIKTDLEMRVYNASLSLSKFSEEMTEEDIAKMPVADYMKFTSTISGGRILDIPQLNINMTTFQVENSMVLEFIYSCTFTGKVGVKWNLSPVSFMKEVWATHVRSLEVRTTQYMSNNSPEDMIKGNIEEEEKLFSKLVYTPLKDPHIEMPQIKDLKDATPPLEWFGVNRKHFPSFTHQYVIVPIQKLVNVAQKEYAKVLGSSSSQ